MRARIGTSGFSYKEWKGSFYPEKMKAGDMLAFYGEHFSTVEMNNTFYRLPKAEQIDNWAAQVPDGFQFTIKASQQITHRKRLKDCADPLGFLLETTSRLGDKLGPLLFQLPPNAKKNAERLAGFLELLPDDRRAAFEFRNETWNDDEIYELLRKHNCALCVADRSAEDAEKFGEAELVPTADWGYLRLRRVEYTDDELTNWASNIKAQGWGEAFVYFKHEDEATGPALAKRIAPMLDE